MIEIGKKGKIIEGEYKGWYILIQDDYDNTGGFLVLQFEDFDGSANGYDDWVENLEDLKNLFRHKNWVVEWMHC